MRHYLISSFVLAATLQIFSCRYDKPSLLEGMTLADTLDNPGKVDTSIELNTKSLLENSSFTDWKVLGRNAIGAFCHVPNQVASVKSLTTGNYFMCTDFDGRDTLIVKLDDNADDNSGYRFLSRRGNESLSYVEGPFGYSIRGQSITICYGYLYLDGKVDSISWGLETSENTSYDITSFDHAIVTTDENSSESYLALNTASGFTMFPIVGKKVQWNNPYHKDGFFLRGMATNNVNEFIAFSNLSDGNRPSMDRHCVIFKFDPGENPIFKTMGQFTPNKLYEHFCLFGNLLFMMHENQMWWSLDYGKTQNQITPLVNFKSLSSYGARYAVENGNVVTQDGTNWTIISNISIEGSGHIIQADYDDNFMVGTKGGKLYTGGFLSQLKRIY